MHNIEITNAERQSALWLKLVKHHQEMLDMYRRQNDELNLDKTERLRGRIVQCKIFLALDNPTPTVVNDD